MRTSNVADAAAQEELADSLDISQVPGSTELIYITPTARASKFTKAAVKSIRWAFIKFQKTGEDLLTDATTSAYQSRKNDTERAIRESGAQILELSKEFGTTDLKSAIDQKTMQINEVEAQINALNMRLAEIPPTDQNPGAVPLTPLSVKLAGTAITALLTDWPSASSAMRRRSSPWL